MAIDLEVLTNTGRPSRRARKQGKQFIIFCMLKSPQLNAMLIVLFSFLRGGRWHFEVTSR